MNVSCRVSHVEIHSDALFSLIVGALHFTNGTYGNIQMHPIERSEAIEITSTKAIPPDIYESLDVYDYPDSSKFSNSSNVNVSLLTVMLMFCLY